MSFALPGALLRVCCGALLVIALACSSKSTTPRVFGELVEVLSGTATRRTSDAGWTEASAGNQFVDGDALRTASASEARVQFAGELLRMGPATTIHFGHKTLDFEGEIEVKKGFAELGIDFGEAEVTTTGTLRLFKSGKRIRFEVVVGEATVTERGKVAVIETGQTLVFELGTGVVEKITKRALDAGVSVEDAMSAQALSDVRVTVTGKDVQMRSGSGASWVNVREGTHELKAKTELALKGRSSVVLERGSESVTLSGPSLAVISDQEGELVELKKGRAAARSHAGPIRIAVPGGSIQLHGGSSPGNAQIEVGRDGTLTTLVAGRATLQAGDEHDELVAGESALLSEDGIEVLDRAPTSSHLTLKEPDGAILHTPQTPLYLRIDFRDQCERGIVEVARGRSFKRPTQSRSGQGSAILSLGSGTHRYRVRCFIGDSLASSAAVEGRVSVKRDSGNRPLPPTSPKNTIDADGRSYTVLFQNRPPALRFRWPKAAKSDKYVLNVVPRRGKPKVSQTSKPEKDFESGSFSEGDYEYWFAGGGRESKHSRLTLAFDNAASTGYLSSPKPGDQLSGAEVRVSGAAVTGWKVYVGDKELRLDNQYRFDEMVPVAEDGLAVRFTHPSYGTHYYLRHK